MKIRQPEQYKKRSSADSLQIATYVVIILLVIFGFLFISTFFGCSTEPELQEQLDSSGIYQSVDYDGEFHNGYDIKLFLIHSDKSISGIGEFNGAVFSFDGVKKGNEIMITLSNNNF